MISLSWDPENHYWISGRDQQHICFVIYFVFLKDMVVLANRKLINMLVIECDLQKANSVLRCIYGNII